MPITTRTKELTSSLHQGGYSVQGWTREANFYDTSYMVSEGHDVRLLGTGDVGGPWVLNKTHDYATSNVVPYQVSWGTWVGGQTFINGPYPGAGCPYIQPLIEPSTSTMIGLGTTAIAKSLPTNPYVNLASDVAEAASNPATALPSVFGSSLWKEKALTAKSAGNEYLNLEFGWLPLVSDVKKTAFAIKHHSALLRSFIQGSGKKTRKGFHFPRVETSYLWDGLIWADGSTGGFGYPGTVYQKQTTDTWFNGCFTYYVPDGHSQLERIARAESLANHLLGTRITPEVLWNATPWSWAADWVGNMGDVLRNLGAFSHDGLVMQYGYVMQTQRLLTEFHIDNHDIPSLRVVADRTIDSVWKKRLAATPYGFNVDLHSLSVTQIAILTALGFTHGIPGFGA